jgi:hypothetical protein
MLVTDNAQQNGGGHGRHSAPGLPRHLAALTSALKGPPDLAANHDKCLAYSACQQQAVRR